MAFPLRHKTFNVEMLRCRNESLVRAGQPLSNGEQLRQDFS